MILENERRQVAEYGVKLLEAGITVGTFGNLSIYNPEQKLMAISPSGVDYRNTAPEDIVVMTLDGEKMDGKRKPSSEYDLHRVLYQRRRDVLAVIHTHSVYATTLACLHWKIEPVHYIIGYAGHDIPCSPYVQFGTYELAESVYETMGGRNACLMGNHGLLCCGGSLEYTFDIAQQVEFLAQIYYNTRVAGKPILLTEDEVSAVLEGFKAYRQK